jgi:Mor family transcriptional regulator
MYIILNNLSTEQIQELRKKQVPGTHIYIPKIPKPHHQAVEKLGLEFTRNLAKVYGGQTIQFNTFHRFYVRDRNEEIKKRAREGESHRQLAKSFNLSYSLVCKILS